MKLEMMIAVLSVVGAGTSLIFSGFNHLLAKRSLNAQVLQRRFEIYDGLKKYAWDVLSSDGNDVHDIRHDFDKRTGAATFVFSDKITAYIKDVQERGEYYLTCINNYDCFPPEVNPKEEMEKAEACLLRAVDDAKFVFKDEMKVL